MVTASMLILYLVLQLSNLPQGMTMLTTLKLCSLLPNQQHQTKAVQRSASDMKRLTVSIGVMSCDIRELLSKITEKKEWRL